MNLLPIPVAESLSRTSNEDWSEWSLMQSFDLVHFNVKLTVWFDLFHRVQCVPRSWSSWVKQRWIAVSARCSSSARIPSTAICLLRNTSLLCKENSTLTIQVKWQNVFHFWKRNCTCAHTCAHCKCVRIHTCITHTHTCAPTHPHTHTCTHTHTHTRTRTHIHTHTCTHTLRVQMHTCSHTHIHTHACTHTHTHTHTFEHLHWPLNTHTDLWTENSTGIFKGSWQSYLGAWWCELDAWIK